MPAHGRRVPPIDCPVSVTDRLAAYLAPLHVASPYSNGLGAKEIFLRPANVKGLGGLAGREPMSFQLGATILFLYPQPEGEWKCRVLVLPVGPHDARPSLKLLCLQLGLVRG
jgi:hypothetical protein